MLKKVSMTFIMKQDAVSAKDFSMESYLFDLPQRLIATRPDARRDQSRLLVYQESIDNIIHTKFNQLSKYLSPGTLLVFNQSKVFPCRLLGEKSTGGKCEMFVISLQESPYPVVIKCAGKKKINDRYLFSEGVEASLVDVKGNGIFAVKFNKGPLELKVFLKRQGKVPLPPYIRKGIADERDIVDYQTVFAKITGSVAAPTAGLHFTRKLLQLLEEKGMEHAFITLHVGPGTFFPVRTEDIRDHYLHPEYFWIDGENSTKIKKAKQEGRNIVAVGTTTLRALESSLDNAGNFIFYPNEKRISDLFIHPGIPVRSVNGLITNFHLPSSSLLMLASTLIGREKILELYRDAIDKEYRFFSYGDAMLILRTKCLH